MSSLPVLALPDFTGTFDITIDASGIVIGAVLSQSGHPLAFFSKKLCPRIQVALAYDREMFAITEAVKKWRQYVLDCHFRIYTDQQSLCSMLSQVIQIPSQHKWLIKLLGFYYEILYTPGCANIVVDALSRPDPPLEPVFSAFSTCQPLLLDQWREFYASHPVGRTLITKFQDSGTFPTFSVQQGILYCKNRIFIPLETNLR